MAMAIGGAALSADAETPRWDLAGSEAQAVETLDPDGRVSFDPEMVSLARRFGVRVELAAVIYEESRQAGVEPAMVFGMIAQESAFDPWAVGRQGERGLLQIKPSTAWVYDRRITPDQLHDPEVNLRLALQHLKQEVKYFGDQRLGLMSYHMGRARLERAMVDGVPPRDRYVDEVLSSCGPDCG